jgi:glycerol-3-phosphate cytidylyltransferase
MKKIGYATGVFDMFHVGHLNLLRRARMACDHLIVGVSSDELVEELKGKRPIIPFTERVEIVASLRHVDEVVAETSADKMDAWLTLGFHVTFKGDDWKGSPKWRHLEKEFSARGVAVVYLPYTNHTSSTRLRTVLDKLYADICANAVKQPSPLSA